MPSSFSIASFAFIFFKDPQMHRKWVHSICFHPLYLIFSKLLLLRLVFSSNLVFFSEEFLPAISKSCAWTFVCILSKTQSLGMFWSWNILRICRGKAIVLAFKNLRNLFFGFIHVPQLAKSVFLFYFTKVSFVFLLFVCVLPNLFECLFYWRSLLLCWMFRLYEFSVALLGTPDAHFVLLICVCVQLHNDLD